MAEPADRAVRYRFSPLERRGIIAGWRGGQIAAVAVSLVVAVAMLRAEPSIGGLLLALSATGCGVAVAFWPVRGRTPEQWLPLLVRWSLVGAGGRIQVAPGPRSGHVVSRRHDGGGTTVTAPDHAIVSGGRHRGVFDGVRLVGVPIDADRIGGSSGVAAEAGVVLDGPGRTATAVLAVRGHSFALLSETDQEARVAAWAAVLASLAREGSEVHRLQWIESCLPDDGSAVRRHTDEHAVLSLESPAGRSYRALLDESAPVTRRHKVLLGLTVHTARSGRAIRASGGGDRGSGTVLTRQLMALRRALDGADISVDGVLGPAALAGYIRGAVAAGSDRSSDGDEPAEGSPTGVHSRRGASVARWPWPMAVRPDWDAVRTDGTWHAVYWIAEWPRVDVTPDFVGPLLFAPMRRSIVMVMEPVSPIRAARQVARARTADIADGELRRRGGFLTSARQRREQHGVEERDTELADGHGQFRFCGYVVVTASSSEELAVATVHLEQLAGQSHLEVRRLYGEQDVAFACCLPLGRGLT